MRRGRKKCDKCCGKGGVTKFRWAFGIAMQVFEPCIQCAAKGSWWPNNTKLVKAK